MEEKPSRAHLKRPFPEDDDSNKPPTQKRVRFPKGKKVKPGNEKVDVWKPSEDLTSEQVDARNAAKERAMQRNQITAELLSEENRGMLHDISAAEVRYEIEPFNLEKEREEGYFDEQGNFVEYIHENEIKDAWLDSVEVDPKLAAKGSMLTNMDDDIPDLSSQEIGQMKRRIADVLEPGETVQFNVFFPPSCIEDLYEMSCVLRALRRLKGTSNNKKEKMPAETKQLFDQLTEDAMKLMENGDYNVYDEKQEVFQREAEGYERLARARGEGDSMDTVANDYNSSVLLATTVGPSNMNVSSAEILPSNGDDAFDMFAEDDENGTANPTAEGSILVSGPTHDRIGQPSESGGSQNDYVYDESSGYYYSSSLGYYYDPSSGLYCCAASGQCFYSLESNHSSARAFLLLVNQFLTVLLDRYSYNEVTGAYDEVQEAATATDVS
ncbi:hypothetical protein TEA_002792 [Camellia sinensis var. sinensis]|uniref:OCRE domain-containing protein n=1 Tax=Camellia sinensis var. sinensis TaxID=542762 RepID=A0A4S4DIV7_CAMSN|nr:hypothetical protein TEA_002792 [Camellia sinensis var. sinensis]